METKVYVAYKKDVDKPPHIICRFHKKGPLTDLSEYGLTYFEDEIGWYSKHGELICSAE